MIKLSAFRWVPPFAQGLVRDLRARWALEEAQLPYEIQLIGPEEQTSAGYRSCSRSARCPRTQDDSCFRIRRDRDAVAEQSEALWPADRRAQARVKTWWFAALNSIEPPLSNLAEIDLSMQTMIGRRAPASRGSASADRFAELATAPATASI